MTVEEILARDKERAITAAILQKEAEATIKECERLRDEQIRLDMEFEKLGAEIIEMMNKWLKPILEITRKRLEFEEDEDLTTEIRKRKKTHTG